MYHENTWNQRYLSYKDKPDNCNGTIPIVAHWGAGWHTSIVIPNKNIELGKQFKKFPFLEINWGDKGFYKAGSSQLKQKIAVPKALLVPSQSVLYVVGVPENKTRWCALHDSAIELSDKDKLLLSRHKQNNNQKHINTCSKIEHDYGDLFQYYDARQIWVTQEDFSALIKKINHSIRLNSNGNPVDLGNGYLFNSAYSTASRFFESDSDYYGIFYTCNSWSAEILGEVESLKEIESAHIYRSEAIFQFIEQEIKDANSCVKKFE